MSDAQVSDTHVVDTQRLRLALLDVDGTLRDGEGWKPYAVPVA
ncbi:MAG: hypothetical protein V9G19_23000 [Tetrasphaera sp.]